MGNPFKAVGRYFMRVLLGIDQLGNTLAGGYPDETISARVGRRRDEDPLAKVIAAALDKIDKDHTREAIESERTGRQQEPAYRDVYDPEDAVIPTYDNPKGKASAEQAPTKLDKAIDKNYDLRQAKRAK